MEKTTKRRRTGNREMGLGPIYVGGQMAYACLQEVILDRPLHQIVAYG